MPFKMSFRRKEFSWNGIWKLETDYRDNSREGHMTLWTAEHIEKEVRWESYKISIQRESKLLKKSVESKISI